MDLIVISRKSEPKQHYDITKDHYFNHHHMNNFSMGQVYFSEDEKNSVVTEVHTKDDFRGFFIYFPQDILIVTSGVVDVVKVFRYADGLHVHKVCNLIIH